MKFRTGRAYLLAAALLFIPAEIFARGFGGHAGGGGGGARPSFGGGGGGGARPGFSGGGARPGGGGGGGARPNFGGGGGGGGARPNLGGGGIPNRSPSFSHPTGGGSAISRPGNINPGGGNRPQIGAGNRPSTLPGAGSRPSIGGGNRPEIGAGNRPQIGTGNRPSTLPGIGNRPNIGGGNRPEIGGGNRPNLGGGNLAGGNRPNIGDGNRPSTLPGQGNRPNLGGGGNRPDSGGNNRPNFGGNNRPNFGGNTNIGQIGNNFNNIHNNINIASNRPYYNNWQHGNWNGNWNRPGGGGYWNGWAHGYAHGYWNGGWGGYWHGGWGGYWGRPWYAAPITWGLGAWALGSIMYSSGYAMYSNPYYVSTGTTSAYYDYSQPITVINQQPDTYAATDPTVTGIDNTVPAAPTPEVQQGTSHMDLAREAFKSGDYATASSEIDLAIQALPKDAALHEFRALVFFATRDYKQAAGTLYAVLSAGPGWDWTTLSSMYPATSVYTDQLRELETYVKANPSAADARFVLAYHYLTCGYADAARTQYEEVLKLQPTDQLSAQLVKLLGPAPTTADASSQPTPQPPDAAPTTESEPVAPAAIDATKLIGKWTAKRPNGPTFTLNLTQDSKFTWMFEQGGKKEEFGGKYSVDGAVLVLERTDGAQMPGLITLTGNGFNFKLYGGPPDDQGLDFRQ